jgi:hypothetical protein
VGIATVLKATHGPGSTTADQVKGEALGDDGVAKIGGGNFLKTHLPLVIEVENSGGAEQITIPGDNDTINSLVEKCTAQNLPSYDSVPVEPSPPAPDQQQSTDQVETASPKADDYSTATPEDEKAAGH